MHAVVKIRGVNEGGTVVQLMGHTLMFKPSGRTGNFLKAFLQGTGILP